MIYGYARVSTKGQELETQLIALSNAGCEQIFQEKITGTKMDRMEFQKVLSLLKEGDTLVVSKMDRFARSTLDAIRTINELFARGVAVHILNMGLVENNPAGRLIFNVMSCFAEFERDIILERTATGKALAKERPDFHEGRPPIYKRAQKEHALKLLETHTYTEVENKTGMSRATLIRARRKQRAQELQNVYDIGEIAK